MRSNNLSAALVAIMLVCTGSTLAAQQPTRIAYVNPQALFAAAPGREQAESTFAKEIAGYREELNRLGRSLQQQVDAYEREESKLTEAQKTARQRSLNAKNDSLRQRQQELDEVAARRQSELMAPIMESVRKVLEDIRVEDGYTMILSSEPGQSPILVADKNLDITERVVARLRTVSAARPAPAQQRPATGAPTAAPSGVTRPRPPER